MTCQCDQIGRFLTFCATLGAKFGNPDSHWRFTVGKTWANLEKRGQSRLHVSLILATFAKIGLLLIVTSSSHSERGACSAKLIPRKLSYLRTDRIGESSQIRQTHFKTKKNLCRTRHSITFVRLREEELCPGPARGLLVLRPGPGEVVGARFSAAWSRSEIQPIHLFRLEHLAVKQKKIGKGKAESPKTK